MQVKTLLKYCLILIFLIYGCAAHMTPRDRAASIGYEASNIYFSMKARYLDTLNDPSLTEEQKMVLSKQAVPLLNHLKSLLTIYLELLIQWDERGVQPNNLSSTQTEIDRVIVALFDIFTKKGGQ